MGWGSVLVTARPLGGLQATDQSRAVGRFFLLDCEGDLVFPRPAASRAELGLEHSVSCMRPGPRLTVLPCSPEEAGPWGAAGPGLWLLIGTGWGL